MRVSIIGSDPGYRDDASRWNVTFNGAPLNDCLTADEERSAVTVLQRDAKGAVMVSAGGHVLTVNRVGSVKLYAPGDEEFERIKEAMGDERER